MKMKMILMFPQLFRIKPLTKSKLKTSLIHLIKLENYQFLNQSNQVCTHKMPTLVSSQIISIK